MKVTDFVRQALPIRRDNKKMIRDGYFKIEAHWKFNRGAYTGTQYRVTDVKISADGKNIWVKTNVPNDLLFSQI